MLNNELKGGEFCGDCAVEELDSRLGLDDDLARKLWTVTEEQLRIIATQGALPS